MNYFDTMQAFIEESKRASEPVELASLFEKKIMEMGCEYFACISSVDPFNAPRGAVVISNYPLDWAKRIYEQEYHKIDPVLRTAESRRTPFRWTDPAWRATLDLDQLNILAEAADMGLADGVSIPIHCGDGFPASCSISFGPNGVENEAIHAVHMMSIYLHEAAVRMRDGVTFLPVRHLSPRQRECLELAAQGKSDWVISELLGISENTVHFHINAAMERFGVATRTQAVVKAIYFGDIHFADVSVEPKDPDLRLRLSEGDPIASSHNL